MFVAKQSKKEIGMLGEFISCKYLKGLGYKIIKRNYREKFQEIDIIGKSKNNLLVFFEVKTIFNNGENRKNITPENNFTEKKFKNVINLCEVFVAKHLNLIDKDIGWRLDLIAITIKENGNVSIHHYKNCVFSQK